MLPSSEKDEELESKEQEATLKTNWLERTLWRTIRMELSHGNTHTKTMWGLGRKLQGLQYLLRARAVLEDSGLHKNTHSLCTSEVYDL